MNMPSLSWRCSSTSTSSSPTRSMPLLAMRRRPTLSRSSSSQACRSGTPCSRSSSLSCWYASLKALGTQRVAWPGAVCSRAVLSAARTARWKSGRIAPQSTASSVKRYAVPIRTPTATPRPVSEVARAATIAAERSSWMPPAKRTCRSCGSTSGVASRKSSRTASCASHSGKLLRGPMCPPHSAPSKTKRRAPADRNCPSSPGEGTCRNVRMPSASRSAACEGRPPAMITCVGRSSRTASSWAVRTSSGAKPRMPTPQGRSPSATGSAPGRSGSAGPRPGRAR